MIPYVDLAAQHRALREELHAALDAVLAHGQFILGPEVQQLETHLARMLGLQHVVGVASGTDALVLALRLRGIGPGDEVITVSHSFVATASAIALVGARPVFVDIDEATMVMDPGLLEAALTPRTRAVIPVHLNGYPCDLDAIGAFCRRHRLSLIEDCAQSLGTRAAGHPVGSRDVGCFSLHPLKVLSACGDAGFISVTNASEADTLRKLRNIGLVDRDHVDDVSGNSRLDTLQAAFLLVKLRHLDRWRRARAEHAKAYRDALRDLVALPPEDNGNEPTISAFVVRHPQRDTVIHEMRVRGVDLKIHYPLAIHQQKAFAHHRVSLPVTERVVSQIFSLPVTPELTVDQRRKVIADLQAVLSELHVPATS
jgi:dTDP-4-amino-4,6-dideoxygalactose transaminase